jgi:hypothetical protein
MMKPEETNPPGLAFYHERIMETFGVSDEIARDIFDYVREQIGYYPTLEDIADYADEIVEEFGEGMEYEYDYGDFEDQWLDEGDEIEESASAYGEGEQ